MAFTELPDIDELQALSKKILSYSKSEWAEVSAEASHHANLRYAANTVTTSGASQNTSVSVTAVNGKRAGSASTNDLSDDGLHRVVRRAEEIASLAPENEELMPPLTTKQEYIKSAAYDNRSTDREWAANQRAKIAAAAIKESKSRNFQTAGFIETGTTHRVLRNSKGIVAGDKQTRSIFSTTMRNADGSSSGWNKRASHAIAQLDYNLAISRASEKCTAWASPKEFDPGVYKAILEPSAAADLVQQFCDSLDARDAEEGRSPFSRPGGKTALGEMVAPEKLSLYTDPAHPIAPGSTYGPDGMALAPTDWIKNGKLMNFTRSRYWAEKTGQKPVPGGGNIIMDGGDMLPEDYMTTLGEGLLVTSFWYIRDLDSQTMLRTGLTRDGLFWVENGQIKHGVSNFRWNESPMAVLKNITGMSRPVATAPRDGNDGQPMYIPLLYVSAFNFASLSDAV